MSEDVSRPPGSHAPFSVKLEGWQPIETAPKDGTAVEAAPIGIRGWPVHPLRARFLNGRWCAEFGPGDWKSYEPQPCVWRTLTDDGKVRFR